MVVQRHDTRPVTDLLANHFWSAPLDLSVMGWLAEHDVDRRIPCPLHLRLALVRHEDDGQRAVRKGRDLRRSTVVASGRCVYVLPPAPGPTVIVGKQRFDVEGAVARRLKNHDQGLPVHVPGISNARHSIAQALSLPVQAPRLRPRRTLIGRSYHHRALVVVRILLRVNQLHLAATALAHKWLPDAVWRSLLHGLRSKLP